MLVHVCLKGHRPIGQLTAELKDLNKLAKDSLEESQTVISRVHKPVLRLYLGSAWLGRLCSGMPTEPWLRLARLRSRPCQCSFGEPTVNQPPRS